MAFETKHIFTCDRCEKSVEFKIASDAETAAIRVKIDDIAKGDFCSACVAELRTWLKPIPTTEPDLASDRNGLTVSEFVQDTPQPRDAYSGLEPVAQQHEHKKHWSVLGLTCNCQ